MAWFTIAFAGLNLFAIAALFVGELQARRAPDFDASRDGMKIGDALLIIGFALPILFGGWQAIQSVLT